MLVVFAVGIRQGQVAFIVALSSVGWGEIAQIVRGHVLVIRNQLYILAARAVGLSSAGILSRHVLPNLLATLLALAALEMGSALLLLGELGFLHIFIGGGRTGFDMATYEVRHYFDVPDWGAMLGSSWRWFRSYPWFPMAPALAFFVAILGFNLFGYGLQRFIERGRFHPSGWSVFRVLLVITLLLLGARALLQNAGMEAQFARLARQFDVSRAWEDIAYLTQPELEGRPTGSDGGAKAADYITSQFEQAGLTPTTPEGSYFQPYTAARGQVTAAPDLEVLDKRGGPQLWLTSGISIDPWQAFHAEGSTEAELVVMGNTRGTVMEIGASAARQMLAEAGVDLEELQAKMEAGEKVMLHTGLQVRVTYGLVYESDIWTTVVLHGVGAGQPRLAWLEAGAGPARAFDQSARRFRVRTEGLDEWLFFFVSNYSRLRHSEPWVHKSYQALAVTRPGDDRSGTPADMLDHLDREGLLKAGQAVAHFVMVLSSR